MKPDKDIDKIPITVEVPKADVWLRNDYRDIARQFGEAHLILAGEHQHDDDFVPLYDLETLAVYQVEIERLRTEVRHWKAARQSALDGGDRLLEEATRLRGFLRELGQISMPNGVSDDRWFTIMNQIREESTR